MQQENTTERALPYRALFSFVHRYLLQTPHYYLAILMMGVMMAVVEIMIPVLGEHIIRSANIGVEQKDQVYQFFWLLVFVYILYWLFRYGLYYLHTRTITKFMSKIKLNSFQKIQSFSAQWHLDSFAGSTVRDISRGATAFESFIDLVAFTLYPGLILLLGTAGYLFFRWPEVGFAFVLFCTMFIGITGFISLKFVGPRNRIFNLADSAVSGNLSDAISCNIVVRSFGSEDSEFNKLSDNLDIWRKKNIIAWDAAFYNGALQTTLLLAGRFGLIGWALHGWSQGTMDAGNVAFAILMAGLLNAYLRDFGYQIRQVQRSLNEMEAVALFEKTEPAVKDKPDAKQLIVTQAILKFDRVQFRYAENLPLLFSDISVTLVHGQMVALVGASGSGKSTFLKLVQRFYDVQSGSITIDGQDIRDVTQQSLRCAIATVPQEPILFHRSLFDNIAYARPTATIADVYCAAELANAADFIKRLPNGYDTHVGERGVKLSGGERQRIALARAVLADAPLLMLDEATSSLDSVSERLIQQAMATLKQGRTTLVVAHRLSTIQAADRILVFSGGRIVEDGTHTELLALNGVYRHLYDTQYSQDV